MVPPAPANPLANIIANRTNRRLKLSATNAGLADIKEIIAELDSLLANGILLYLDEIQYFNKKQQQSLLNSSGRRSALLPRPRKPLFYIYNALLSRSRYLSLGVGLGDIKGL